MKMRVRTEEYKAYEVEIPSYIMDKGTKAVKEYLQSVLSLPCGVPKENEGETICEVTRLNERYPPCFDFLPIYVRGGNGGWS
jgi:hypothetical protein